MATSQDDLGVEERKAGVTPTQVAMVLASLLLLLLLVWFFFLRSDGSDGEVDTSAPVPVEEVEEQDDDTAVASPDKKSPVETFEVFAPKDPFDPLVSASAVGAGGAQTAGGTTTTDGTGTTTTDRTGTTTTTTDATGTTTTTTTTGGGGGGSDVGGHRVRVIDVYRQGGANRAQVQVDGTVYTIDEGERFADNFQLMSTSGQCATMLFGDDEFTLCEGEEILK